MSVVGHLAGFIARLRWAGVPAEVQGKLADHVLDTLGVMCAGVSAPAAAAARTAVAGWRGAPGCTVVGTSLRLAAPHAAFLNAFHGRIHTYDDTLEAGPVHPGSSVVAASLAAAEASGARGEDLLAGTLAGYETVARIVAAFGPSHYALGFHTTGTCNVFGAAAAACRVRGLDEKATAGALGLAGGMASGLRQYQIDGNISDSAMNGAHAALAGVMAAELAAAGLAGPRGIVDGKFGLGTIAASAADFSRVIEGLGKNYLFAQTAIKPFPTCRFTHGPLEVLSELRKTHHFTAADVAAIEIATFRQSMEVSDKPSAASRSDALLSHQVSAALLLVHGSIDLGLLDSGAYLAAPAKDLTARVRVVHDADLETQYPAAWPHRISVRLRDGRVLQALSRHPPGGIAGAVARPVVEAKFRANAEAVLGRSAAAELPSAVRSLERAAGVGSLSRLLHPPIEVDGTGAAAELIASGGR